MDRRSSGPRFESSLARSGGVGALLVLIAVIAHSATVDRKSSPAASVVESRIDALLATMTLQDKIDLIGGVDGFFIRPLPQSHLPRLKMADGPMGVRNFGPATAMAGGINLAATWDPELAQRVGEQIGRDARAKGVNFVLGPGVNIYRAPMNGRNFEYFGEDPYLASRIAVGYIDGLQSEGVSATIKHFIGNNSEYARHVTNDVIDERTLREIYLPVFEAAVKEAHVGAVMAAYNLVNGEHMTQNTTLDTDILKKEWGFSGVLMSDWGGTYDGVAAANSGLDLEMPSGVFMSRNTLGAAIESGKLSVATIDDKVRRILRLAIESHWLDRDQTDPSIPRYNVQGDEVALEASREGMVLLKNNERVLPLDKQKIKSIAVIGPDAYPAVPLAGGSAGVRPFVACSFLEGISKEAGAGIPTFYDRGIPTLSELAQRTILWTRESEGGAGVYADYFSNEKLDGEPFGHPIESHINFGADPDADLGLFALTYPANAASARWTGYYTAAQAGPYDFFVQSTGEAGGYYRVIVDGKLILDNWTEARALVGLETLVLTAGSHKVVVEHHGRPGFLGARFRFGIVQHGTYVNAEAEKLASMADVVVLAVGFNAETESEGADRTFRLPPGQDELISRMTALNKRTVVVVTSGGSVEMRQWVDRVPGLIEVWYPGQEGGKALAQIIFGEANPSGRLPVSFEQRWEDNPVHDSYYPKPDTEEVAYKEGVFVGYRGYQHNGTKPLFPFGDGLSYTKFRYQNLSIRPIAAPSTGAGSDAAPAYEVSFDVTNIGDRDGAEVAQVYVGEMNPSVPRPERELKSFSRMNLRVGATQHVHVMLNDRAFAYYDVGAHEWRIDPAKFTISVGSSVDQIQLQKTISLSAYKIASSGHN